MPTDRHEPEPNPSYSSHPSPNPAVAAGGKLWTEDDQQKADYFLNRDGWLPCFGCGSEGPYRRYGDHSYCATCIREGVPWVDEPRNSDNSQIAGGH